MERGLFIALEGIEGTGKSTQARMLTERLNDTGRRAQTTREPGGSLQAEAIRQFIFDQGEGWQPNTQLLMMMAARNEHVHTTILPALQEGVNVVCDRFVASSYALQGASGCDNQTILDAHRLFFGDLLPDITFVLDMDPERSLVRLTQRGDTNFFDDMSLVYHNQVRRRFNQWAVLHQDTHYVIDAHRDTDTIHDDLWSHLTEHLSANS